MPTKSVGMLLLVMHDTGPGFKIGAKGTEDGEHSGLQNNE
jgi:hypothetical protein